VAGSGIIVMNIEVPMPGKLLLLLELNYW